ncbi:hypothetical protein [Acetivibrio straminisolvens]|nr:hypothetical protein [Acetivibrio straminisolvens]
MLSSLVIFREYDIGWTAKVSVAEKANPAEAKNSRLSHIKSDKIRDVE